MKFPSLFLAVAMLTILATCSPCPAQCYYVNGVQICPSNCQMVNGRWVCSGPRYTQRTYSRSGYSNYGANRGYGTSRVYGGSPRASDFHRPVRRGLFGRLFR